MKHKLIFLLASALVLLACEIPAFSVPSPSTPVPGVIETIIFETAAAAQTQTAEGLPSTRTPTRPPTLTVTPTKTPLPTPTVLFLFPTKTPNPNEHNYQGTLHCSVVAQSPSDGTVFKPRQKFTVQWTVKNTGTAAWKIHSIDYRYLGGDRFHDRDRYDMNFVIDPGETIDMNVDMRAPKEPGSYETTWVVDFNKGGICKMILAIVVK